MPGKISGVFDAHIHVQPWEQMRPEVLATMRKGHGDFETLMGYSRSVDRFLKHLDQEGIARAVLVNYVSPDLMGFTDSVNGYLAEYCRGHSDRLVAMGSVHPRFSKDPAGDVDRLVEMGVRALKIHPPHQLFHPNDYRTGKLPGLEAIYRKASEHRIPVMFHTGTSIFPGARNVYGDPITLDDVAVDFPSLTMVLAHGGRPLWGDTAFFLVRRFPNVHMDISGIPPRSVLKMFPRLEEISHKVLFGSDWPGPAVPAISKNVAEVESLPLGEKALQRILRDNALAIYRPA
jgi:predicted TIM-barrel fold metal-dependent hydrolase